MTDPDLLRRMDLNYWEMFREFTRFGSRTEILDTARFTLMANPLGSAFNNGAMVRDRVEPDELIAALRAFYGVRDLPFSIGTRDHTDGDLQAELERRGFKRIFAPPGMILQRDPGTKCEPPGLEIRATTDDRGRRDFLEVSALAYSTWNQPRAFVEDVFAPLESVCGPHLQGFVGYVRNEPVAAAAVYLTHGVAGIAWVGTHPECRGKGYAEAVTWAASREGFRRGAAFVNLQASPMGEPVYRRMGFETKTAYGAYVGSLPTG